MGWFVKAERSKWLQRLAATGWQLSKQVVRHPHPARFVFASVLLRLRVAPSFLRIHRNGYVLRFYPTALTRFMWSDPDWVPFPGHPEQDDGFFLRRYLRAGDMVIDVGANIGDVGLLASTIVGPTGMVTCIEPNPKTFRYLQGNVAVNGRTNMRLFNVAMGCEDGIITFSSKIYDDLDAVTLDGSGIVVPVRRLDSLVSSAEIALLKIDTEGYEKFVVQGARGVLPQIKCVYFEAFEEFTASFGYASNEVVALLAADGFATFSILEDGSLMPVGPTYRAQRITNLIAARNVAELRQRTKLIIRHPDGSVDMGNVGENT